MTVQGGGQIRRGWRASTCQAATAKAKRTVTNGARASGTSRSVACIEMPPRLAEECSEAPRFDPS
ncbi:MAG: hypothetical protein RL698_3147 [Pseudomonadota bacterium]|jgi:hypothetical protein